MKFVLSLAITLAIVISFVALYHWAPAREIAQVAHDQGIDTGAYYYTELEQSYQAEVHIRHALDTSPYNSRWALVLAVLLGAVLFFFIFWLGFKYLP